MDEDRGGSAGRVPAISPTHEGYQRCGEIGAFGRQSIFVAKRAGLIGDLLDDVVGDKLGQPIGEEVLGDAEIGLELPESMNPAKDVAGSTASSGLP